MLRSLRDALCIITEMEMPLPQMCFRVKEKYEQENDVGCETWP